MSAIQSAEKASGGARKMALTTLASQLDSDASSAADAKKVRMLSAAVKDLANATR